MHAWKICPENSFVKLKPQLAWRRFFWLTKKTKSSSLADCLDIKLYFGRRSIFSYRVDGLFGDDLLKIGFACGHHTWIEALLKQYLVKPFFLKSLIFEPSILESLISESLILESLISESLILESLILESLILKSSI